MTDADIATAEIAGRYRITDREGNRVGDWQPVKIERVDLVTGTITIDPPEEIQPGQRLELIFDYGLVRHQSFGTFEVIP